MINDNRPWMCNRTDRNEWRGEEYATRDEAVAAALLEAAEYGEDRMHVGRKTPPTIDIPQADRIIEDLQMTADEEAGEAAEGWLDKVTRKQTDVLDAAVTEVVKKWLRDTGNEPGFYSIQDIEEIETPQPVNEGGNP